MGPSQGQPKIKLWTRNEMIGIYNGCTFTIINNYGTCMYIDEHLLYTHHDICFFDSKKDKKRKKKDEARKSKHS